MATATLKRFDMLLKQSSMMAQMGNLTGWFRVLMDLRRNIYPFVPDTEWGEIEKKFNELPKGWRISNDKVSPDHYSKVHRTLDEIYMDYIKVMKSKGLLMPKSLDTSKSVIQM